MGHHSDRRFDVASVAKLDSEKRQESQPAARLAEAVIEDLAADAVVLDIGVGTGYFAIPVAKLLGARGGTARVVGADVEPQMLALFRERAAAAGQEDRIDTLAVPDDAFAVPLADASVDRVVLAMVYHEVPDRAATLAEVARLLRPGGRVLILDWAADGDPAFGPPLDRRVPVAAVEAELRAAGFTGLTVLPLYDDTYTLRAER